MSMSGTLRREKLREENEADEPHDDNPTVQVNVSEEQLAQVRHKLQQAQDVNKKLQTTVIQQKMRYFELKASIKAKMARVTTHEAEEQHRSRIVDMMKSSHQQFHLEQTQQTFDLSKQVMTLDERILEVQNNIATTQEEYKVHRKHILDQEEKIKQIQTHIKSCQVQIEILKGKPGEQTSVAQDFGNISLMPTDDFIPTAQNSPRWEATGGEDEISRLGHAVDLTNSVRTSRPSQLMDLASCHLESLLPAEDVARMKQLLSPQREWPDFKDGMLHTSPPAEDPGDGGSARGSELGRTGMTKPQSPDKLSDKSVKSR